MRVLVFGDSIAYGAWDSEGGWVERLKKDYHQITLKSEGKEKRQVINLGIGGDTSQKILARVQKEIKARQSKSWPFVLVFAFGTNDCRLIDGKVEVDEDSFLLNTAEIIKWAKDYSSKILFLLPPPIGVDVLDFKGQEYSNKRIDIYRDLLNSVATRNKLHVVNIAEIFKSSSDVFCYDKLHPNSKGHKLIYDAVKSKIEEML